MMCGCGLGGVRTHIKENGEFKARKNVALCMYAIITEEYADRQIN